MITGAIAALVGVVVGYALHSAVFIWREERRWSRANAEWFARLDEEMREEDRRHGH